MHLLAEIPDLTRALIEAIETVDAARDGGALDPAWGRYLLDAHEPWLKACREAADRAEALGVKATPVTDVADLAPPFFVNAFIEGRIGTPLRHDPEPRLVMLSRFAATVSTGASAPAVREGERFSQEAPEVEPPPPLSVKQAKVLEFIKQAGVIPLHEIARATRTSEAHLLKWLSEPGPIRRHGVVKVHGGYVYDPESYEQERPRGKPYH
jgi:hypothetical protein